MLSIRVQTYAHTISVQAVADTPHRFYLNNRMHVFTYIGLASGILYSKVESASSMILMKYILT